MRSRLTARRLLRTQQVDGGLRALAKGNGVALEQVRRLVTRYTHQWGRWLARDRSSLDIVMAVGLLGLATALMLPVREHLNLLNLGLIYLILVIVISLIARRWVSASAAVIAFVLFDVFFILPYYTLVVARTDHLLGLSVFLGVAVLISQLVYLVRRRTLEALRHGRQMEMLYELSQALIADVDLDSMLVSIVERVVLVFGVRSCAVVTLDNNSRPIIRVSRGAPPDVSLRDEEALLRWVIEQRQPAGVGSHTGRIVRPHGSRTSRRIIIPRRRQAHAVLYIPIAIGNRVLGGLRVAGAAEGMGFTHEDQQQLSLFANQAALSIERIRLTEEATRAEVLARSDELKSALLSAVSHDLRTPLAAIKASATSMLQEDIAWTPEDRRDLLQTIDEEADRLARIVSNLLDLSRIEAGVLRPDRDWNEVAEVVSDAVVRTHSLTQGREVTVDIADDLPLVRLDYVEISQVLVNLIENAVKYSPSGQPIDIVVRHYAEEIEVSIADRGGGIPAGQEREIFSPFSRLGNGSGASGTGIGLAICKGIIEAHGGRIRVSRRADGGSVFRFTLPVEPDSAINPMEPLEVST